MRWNVGRSDKDEYRRRRVFAWLPTLENRTQQRVWLEPCEVLEFRWAGRDWYQTTLREPLGGMVEVSP